MIVGPRPGEENERWALRVSRLCCRHGGAAREAIDRRRLAARRQARESLNVTKNSARGNIVEDEIRAIVCLVAESNDESLAVDLADAMTPRSHRLDADDSKEQGTAHPGQASRLLQVLQAMASQKDAAASEASGVALARKLLGRADSESK